MTNKRKEKIVVSERLNRYLDKIELVHRLKKKGNYKSHTLDKVYGGMELYG